MATAGVHENRIEDLAARLGNAPFVSIRYRPDGDALAAAGLLARALTTIDIPFQAAVRPVEEDPPTTDGDCRIRVGFDDRTDAPDGDDPIAIPGVLRPASLDAFALANEIGDGDPDRLLALAGGIAAAVRDGDDPFEEGATDTLGRLRDRAHEHGRIGDRKPGIATPTADVADGLAHSTTAHTDWSGDIETARERITALDDRALASFLSCSVVAGATTPRAAAAIERALRPTPITADSGSIPFATIEGYADVLGALGVDRPGIGLALALGADVTETALETWRAHARRAHGALRAAPIARYDGLCVARLDEETERTNTTAETDANAAGPPDNGGTGTPVRTIARLLRDFRCPEPVGLAVGPGVGAIASDADRSLGAVAMRAGETSGGVGHGSARLGWARFEDDPDSFVAAVRAALAEAGTDE